MTDPIIARLDARRNASTVLQADHTTPDQHADAMRLAQRTRLPVGAVVADPNAARRQVEREELDALANDAPVAARWAQHPDNYAVARDDIGTLGKIARTVGDWESAFKAAIPRTIGSTLSGGADLFDAVGRRTTALLDPLMPGPRWTPLGERFGNPANLVREGGDAAKAFADTIDVPAERQTLGTDIASGVGQLGTQVVQALVAAPTVLPSLYAQGADQMQARVDQAGKAGTLEGDASVIGGAAITGLTEKYGLDKLLNRVPPKIKSKVLRWMADVSFGGGIEAAQEVAENLGQDILTRSLIDPDTQIGAGILRQAEAAGGSGMIARLLVSALGVRRSHAVAQVERQQVDQLVTLAAESKTRARARPQFEQLVDTLAPERNVYVPLEALQQHYKGQDVAAQVNDLAGSPTAYAEAVETGAEVVIPLSRYVARIGTQAHAALAGQIRTTPGEDIKPDSVLPDRAQIEADIAAGLEEARNADTVAPGAPVQSDAHRRPLLTDPTQADDWTGYQAAVAAERDAARQAVEQERQRAQARAQDAQLRKQTQAEVEAELRAHPVYAAERLLRNGRKPDGTPVEHPIKLDAAAVVEALGEEGAAKLKGLTRKRNGTSPDEAAALLGYESGAKLLHDLSRAPALADMVQVETDARLQARETPPEGADDAVTDAQAAVMLREIQALENRNGGIRTHAQVLKEVAQRLIGQKTIREVQPHLYRQAEAKAGREAFLAASKQDWRAAAAARRRQLQNLFLYREARNAREEAASAGKYLAQFGKRSTRAKLGKAGADYLEQIDGILGRFDFAPLTGPQDHARTRLADWIKAKGEQGIVIDVPPTIADEAFRMPFKRLKVGELRELRQAVEHIAHMANEANLIRLGDQRFDRMVLDESMALAVRDGHRKRPQRTGDRTVGDVAREEVYKARAVTGAATDLARELDGFTDGGAVWDHTVRVMREAGDRTSEALDTAREAVAAIKLRHYTKPELRALSREKRYFPEVGDSWSKGRILSLALNWGNTGNREAVLTQAVNRLSPAQVGVLLGSLDARDWDFVEDVWRQVDSYWPQIQASQRQRKGLAPEKVPAAPFTVTLPDGTQRQIAGGYFPLKYEADTVTGMREAADDYYDAIRTGKFAKAATRDGHTIERIGSGGRTVRLDLGVIDTHLRDVVRDLHLGDAINFVHTALHGKAFGEAVRDTATVPLVKGLDTWLRDVASGEMGLRTAGEQAVRVLRTNFTAAVLTWRVSSALMQVTGVIQSGVVLGNGPMLDGIQRFMRRPVAMTRYAKEASPFMRRRLQTHVEAVQMVMNAQAGKLSAARAEMIRRGYWMIGRVQGLVDVATWIAAEKQGMARFDGDVAKARAFADDVVARAQGSGEFIDKTALQRGTLGDNVRQSEYIRATTALMGYLIAKQNVGYELVRKTRLRDVRQSGKLAGNLVMLLSADAMLAALIRGKGPDDEDDDGSRVDDWLALAAKEGAANLFGGIPGLSQMVTEMRGYTSRSVVSDAWHAAAMAMTQAEQGELDKPALKSAVTVAGFAVGVPSTQVNKTIEAIAARQDGREVSPYEYLDGPARK